MLPCPVIAPTTPSQSPSIPPRQIPNSPEITSLRIPHAQPPQNHILTQNPQGEGPQLHLFCLPTRLCYRFPLMNSRIGVLLSGRGSNFVALADSVDAGRIPNAENALVLRNRE